MGNLLYTVKRCRKRGKQMDYIYIFNENDTILEDTNDNGNDDE